MEYVAIRDGFARSPQRKGAINCKCFSHLFGEYVQCSVLANSLYSAWSPKADDGQTIIPFSATGHVMHLFFSPHRSKGTKLVRPDSHSTLLSLPAELREQIWDQVFGDRSRAIEMNFVDDCVILAGKNVKSCLSALSTCKQIMQEGGALFFGRNIFVYGLSDVIDFLNGAPDYFLYKRKFDVVHLVSARVGCLQSLKHLCIVADALTGNKYRLRSLVVLLTRIPVTSSTHFFAWFPDKRNAVARHLSSFLRLLNNAEVRSLQIRSMLLYPPALDEVVELWDDMIAASTRFTLPHCVDALGEERMRVQTWAAEFLAGYQASAHEDSDMKLVLRRLLDICSIFEGEERSGEMVAEIIDDLDWHEDDRLWELWKAEDELEEEHFKVQIGPITILVRTEVYQVYRAAMIGFLLFKESLKSRQTRITDYFALQARQGQRGPKC